ncbi:hypothetical protein [Pontivivens nitratireducens]|jgi:formate-dependent nitrite reductase membrane component NrfD|uniref:Uncharacterized protein n=1 Tax=Pontivivens nitratireducens TaxID=2758038 RepID=A0A6G7VM32_9RHOB|nr:hypothetical protein [Pontibrevibacter nitratireducens]QIK41064.1 hypothetical protein G8E03_09950 [Pontibrevibacter nitratireducens]
MPLDRFVLIVVAAMAAAGITVYVGLLLSAAITMPPLLIAIVPVLALVAYICVRVIRDRLTNVEDDYYDRIER